jgi:UDP-4-amino-4-deoxy-L-arabinose-oxoglutarate aminotransferase
LGADGEKIVAHRGNEEAAIAEKALLQLDGVAGGRFFGEQVISEGAEGKQVACAGGGFAARELGVAVNWRALPQLTWVRQALRVDPADFPVACELGDRTLSLPLWPDLPDAALEEVVAGLRAVAEDLRRG